MPCRMDGYEEAERDELRNKLKRVEPLLCEAVEMLEKANLLQKGSKALKAWATEHEVGEVERVKREALAKLTPKEKRALGLTK